MTGDGRSSTFDYFSLFSSRKGDEQPTSAAVRLPLVQRRATHLLGKRLNTLNSVQLKSGTMSRFLILLWAEHGGNTPCSDPNK